MKNLFDRLRRWMIRKLGGYTEQFTPIQRQIELTKNVYPQKIQAQISVSPPLQDSTIDFKGYCESRVLELLALELYKSGFILWESQHEPFTQKVNVRGTLYVVNEIKPYVKRWVV